MTGAELYAWRKQQRWTLQNLADELGVDERTIRRWESSEPPQWLRLAIAGIETMAPRGKTALESKK